MHVLPHPTALLELAPSDLGHTPWRTLGQDDIDTFADLTDDHQWIHVDRDRAAEGPYGTTIAHGMLTLALVPVLVGEVLRVDGSSFGLNYGFEKVRFTNPVPAGARIRGAVRLAAAELQGDWVRGSFAVTVEVEDVERPALVAENVILWRV
ncbi:MaoC family dehydratase [Nocardioides sp. 1609]|uniref:MaoC family dehydratase n=1 Tax=Nocardioides sp. 1609 TaxID=2508327 RepID=UPI0010705326|nr:MaoC family dehydratase [Nocardioides sp. 1609]